MKTLALRQVKRLAPSALAVVALGLLVCALGAYGLQGDARLQLPPFELAATVVLYVAPWLLGVAAIAPDGEAGGLAFLTTLPLGRRRHLLLRAAVAAAWTVVVTAPFVALAGATTDGRALLDLVQHASVSPVLFVASLAAGAAARHSLGAFLATPALIAVPVTLYVTFLGVVQAPGRPFYAAAYPGVALALAVAAVRAFGDPGRQAWRPIARVASVLLASVGLGCGATTAAWAAAIAFPERWVSVATVGEVAVLQETVAPDWSGHTGTTRSVLVRRADLQVVGRDVAAAAKVGWERGDTCWLRSTSRDGVLAVVALGDDRHELLDLARREVVASWRGQARRVESFGVGLEIFDEASGALGWLGERPWFVRDDGAVQTFAGDVLLRLPPDTVVHGAGGPRLVVGAPGPLRVIDVRDGSETLLGDVAAAGLSPHGDALVTLERRDGAAHVRLQPLVEERREVVHEVRDALEGTWIHVSFSRDERRALVERQVALSAQGYSEMRSAVVDLVTGEQREGASLEGEAR